MFWKLRRKVHGQVIGNRHGKPREVGLRQAEGKLRSRSRKKSLKSPVVGGAIFLKQWFGKGVTLKLKTKELVESLFRGKKAATVE